MVTFFLLSLVVLICAAAMVRGLSPRVGFPIPAAVVASIAVAGMFGVIPMGIVAAVLILFGLAQFVPPVASEDAWMGFILVVTGVTVLVVPVALPF